MSTSTILSQRNPSRDCGCGLRSPFRRRCDFVCQRSRSQRRSSRRRRQNTLGSSRAAGNHARGKTTGTTMRFDSVNFQYIASVNWRFIMLIKNSLILHHAKPVSQMHFRLSWLKTCGLRFQTEIKHQISDSHTYLIKYSVVLIIIIP